MGRYLDLLRAAEIGRNPYPRSVVLNDGGKTRYSNGLNGSKRDRSYMSYLAALDFRPRQQAKQKQQKYDIYDRSQFSDLDQALNVRPISGAEYDRSLVFCDFETRNTGGCQFEQAGAWRYATDAATEVVTFVYQKDGGDSLLWTPENNSGPLADLAADPGTRLVCFAGFEQAIWQHIMVERHGFAPIPIERWVDMQAVASYFALPRKLEHLLLVLGAPLQKDLAGSRLVRSL